LKLKNNISPETIKAYLAGTLSHAQTHEFEKAMLDDAVLSDMVEGYELLRDKKTDLQQINTSLSDSLQKRIAQKETKILPLWGRIPAYAKAASVLLFLGGGAYFFMNKNEDIAQEKMAIIADSKEEKIADAKSNLPEGNVVIPKDRIQAEMEKIQTDRREVVVQKSKSKVAFDTIIVANNEVAMESKKEEKFDSEVVSKPAPPVAYEPAPASAPVQQAPKSSAPRASQSDVMKSEDAVLANSKVSRKKSSTNIISGTVLDEDSKEPVPNVEILSDDKTLGKTDANGRFNVNNSLIGNKLRLVAPDFENTEIKVINGESQPLFIRPKAELIFIDLKRNKTWKYNPSEHSAQPTVSPDDYLEYLQKNLKKPKQAIDNQIVGNVTVEFKVNKEGKLSDFKIIKSLGYGCDEEAIRVIKDGPNWMSKMSNGEPRRQRVRQEVNF
jgi:TonB family protein